MAKKNGTIKDVAEKAGVSISTVSRVINGNYPVHAETKKRVLEIIDSVNYKPNSIAKNLRSSKSNMIALIVADISNYFFMHLAKGLEKVVAEHGFNILIASSDGDVNKERVLLKSMHQERPAALVITSFDSDGTHIRDFTDSGIPVVMADRFIGGIDCDCVYMDDFNASYMLTKHLLDLGHRKIAIANVLLSISSGRSRYKGYLKALSEKGLKPQSPYVSSGNFDAESSQAWVRGLFKQKSPATALVCANNIMTVGALMAFRELSLEIPRDVSLVSIGEIPLQELIHPKVTSCLHDGFRMGELAGGMVTDRLIQGYSSPGRKKILRSEFIDYGSTAKVGR
ncbi:LacI family DNA-binding transcriptional regulator [Breznakiella homolactica]|uniref:LacI family DNA-binding transcriptional regulator n=1 Tax=Breznakiella homolactica TaxID=2798577 RepID=A0A7T7XPH7_9SPIR|nr:LacI family DNA-binding transcriptional regulator [Breznakiella homolactica]QQO10104.1 LacI family transcriptional regulator [Breznakiella homolactica]